MLIFIRSGRAIVSVDTTFPCRLYVTTMKAMQFNEDFTAQPVKDSQNHYDFVFDSPSLQDSAEESASIISQEYYQMFKTMKLEQSIKYFIFSNFSDSYKNTVTFLGPFFVTVSFLSVLFFIRPKSPKKKAMNAAQLKNR